ncbi:hypothetical protein ACFQS1_39910 [Paractinoplanes rhizophilus]|uniref:Uncharacterized protein n=1 Tax=Paractinoplanes rhizophilus TaxID=1416877 RepID=A0ABW2I5V3_9ACTN
MTWSEQIRRELETALNEAEALGLRLDRSDGACELLVTVCALPAQRAHDPDPRRVLRLLRPTRIRVLLREDGHGGYGPAIGLRGLDDVESFFASLGRWESMYGWEFLDRPERISDWPSQPSLTLDLRPGPSPHCLFWFNECWQTTGTRYCIEGTVDFEDLQITRADGEAEPLANFTAEGRRWREMLYGRRGNPPQVQTRPADAPSWRDNEGGTSFVGDQPGPTP